MAFRYECPEGNPTIDLVNRKLVEKIKDENLFYIISNNLTETIRLSLLKIGLNCEPEHILGIDKFKIPKPNSAAGIMLSEEFSVDPLEVLNIVDRNSDFEFEIIEYVRETKVFFKLIIGPMKNKQLAQNVADNLLKLGYSSIIINNRKN